MGKYCKFCGKELNEAGCCANEHFFKKMCVNCAHRTEMNDQYFCNSEENMQNALQKVQEAIKNAGVEAYKVEFTLQPVALKKPTLKCPKWELGEDVLLELRERFK